MLNVDWSGSCETPAGGVQLSASRARPRSDEVLSEEARGSPAAASVDASIWSENQQAGLSKPNKKGAYLHEKQIIVFNPIHVAWPVCRNAVTDSNID